MKSAVGDSLPEVPVLEYLKTGGPLDGNWSPSNHRAMEVVSGYADGLGEPWLKEAWKESLRRLQQGELRLLNHGLEREDPVAANKLSGKTVSDWLFRASAAGPNSHHPYPGGWLRHHVVNLRSLEECLRTLEIRAPGLSMPRDWMIGAMLFHDLIKSRLMVWTDNDELDDDQGSFGHHWLAVSEALLSGYPTGFCQLILGVHGGWWERTESLASTWERLLVWTGRSPDATEQPVDRLARSPEGWIMRQGEQTWYSWTRQTAQFIRQSFLEWYEREQYPEDQANRAFLLLMREADEYELLVPNRTELFQAWMSDVYLFRR